MSPAEIAAEIAHLEQDAERKRIELANIDGAIQAFRYVLTHQPPAAPAPEPAAEAVVND